MVFHKQFPLSRWWAGVVDLIFPPVCVHCGRVGNFLCPICQEEAIHPPPDTQLQVEGIRHFYAAAAHEGAMRAAIHALKYENTPQLAPVLAPYLAAAIPSSVDVIIPIPLHAARLRERGYNQAGVIAAALGELLACRVETALLVRSKATTSQVTLGAAERRRNLQDAFSLAPGMAIPQQVLLVDDVCTTGSTLGAAAQTLHAAGVAAIDAATLSTAQ